MTQKEKKEEVAALIHAIECVRYSWHKEPIRRIFERVVNTIPEDETEAIKERMEKGAKG